MLKVTKFLNKHLKLFIFLVIVAAVILWIVSGINKAAAMPFPVETYVLEKGDLINSVNVSGTVESENSKKIYTQLTLPVLNNLVEVGDKVSEGDVLCELDIESLEASINQQKAAANSSSAINQNSVALAQKQYKDAVDDLSGGQNGTIAQAEQALISAQNSLKQIEISYDGTILSVTRARENYQYDASDLNRLSLDSALNSRDQAYASYEAAKDGVALAEANLTTAKTQVTHQIEAYENSINSSKIASGSVNSQWISIETMEKDLSKATITAPINGVVTAVYVTNGVTATGLMYVIEDVEDLKITASLKEYDLAFVNEGDIAEIESDATGEAVYKGSVRLIAPTTAKTPTGDNKIGASGEFSTSIKVDSPSTDLRVGSKARVDIIYEEKADVISVPLEAFANDAEGNPILYALEAAPDEGEGIYFAKAVSVEIGMEGDFEVEIITGDLKEGDIIVRNSKNIYDGMKVSLTNSGAGGEMISPAGGMVMIGRKEVGTANFTKKSLTE